MDGNDFGRLAYLVLLGAALLMWFVTHNRQSLGKTLQMAMAWVFIFIGIIAVVGLWGDIRSTVGVSPQMSVTGDVIEVPRSFDGHYYLPMLVNGKPVTEFQNFGFGCVFLKGQQGFSWQRNSNDQYEISGKLKEDGNYMRVSSVVLY